MSPRSEEFVDQARERLAAAREALDSKHPTVADFLAAIERMLVAPGDPQAKSPPRAE